MEQFLPAVTHAIWHFAKAKNPLPARAAAMKSHPRGTHRARGPEDPRVGAYDAALSGSSTGVTSWRVRAAPAPPPPKNGAAASGLP